MLRFFQLGFFIPCLFIIIGCSNDALREETIIPQEPQPEITDHDNIADKKETIDIQPYTFTYQEQEFEIIPFYKEILEFIELARKARKKV